MKKVYLIAGRKRSGKDTFGAILKEVFVNQGKSVELMSFAGPMKQILATTLDITLEKLNVLKDIPSNPHRGYLQRLGTEATKPLFGDDVWVALAEKAVKLSTADVVIFTDFRFPEEKLVNATTIKVVRGNLVDDDADLHISEQALNDFKFDITAHNNGTIADLTAIAKGLE